LSAGRRVLGFWYSFVIGDDWLSALGLLAGVGLTAGLAHAGLAGWWVMPCAVACLLAWSVWRLARRLRRELSGVRS
jgi:Na+(H+)/acetate symporter ActP